MPSLQVVDLNPPESNPLGRTLNAFMKQNEANREADTLKGIYEKYKQDGAKIEDAIQHIRTSKSLGPTAKTTAIKDMLDLQKINNQLVKDQAKADEKKRMDAIENDVLEKIKDKEYTGSEIYRIAKEAGLSSSRASGITNREYREAKEGRLTASSIATEYNRQRKTLIAQLKAEASIKGREPIQAKLKELDEQERRDQQRRNKGEKKFTLELYKSDEPTAEPTVQPVPFQQQEPQQQQAVMKLNATFSPQEWQGKSKWDKQGNEYKSDGSTWVLVQPTK